MPRIEVAKPTLAAGMPRPPLKWKMLISPCSDVARGAERKIDQRLVNALRSVRSIS
jgi:hypothetical protein